MRQHLVSRQLDEQLADRQAAGDRLRVLDVGLGQGTQALRLARAGHRVTGIESDPTMLDAARAALEAEPPPVRKRITLVEGDARNTGAHFLPGAFDVVLCHGVLMYLADPEPVLAGLARVLAPGGLLSLLVRNADALAMRPGIAGDWEAAQQAFDSAEYVNRIGLRVRADRRAWLATTLTDLGAPVRAWYGVRVFTDQAADGEAVPEPPALARLLAAEERAGRTDPYRAVAALLHLCAVRGRPPAGRDGVT